MTERRKVYAVKFCNRSDRTRSELFLFANHLAEPAGTDYFVWVLDNGTEKIV